MQKVTANKLRLDEALIRVFTGLNSINRVMRCNIDGASCTIFIDEVKCMDDMHLPRDLWSETESDYSELEEWKESQSMEVAMELRSSPEGGGD